MTKGVIRKDERSSSLEWHEDGGKDHREGEGEGDGHDRNRVMEEDREDQRSHVDS
jgi:hypothetical protein